MTSSDLSIGVMRSLVGANPRDSVNGNTYSFDHCADRGKAFWIDKLSPDWTSRTS